MNGVNDQISSGSTNAAEDAGQQAHGGIEGQRQVFAVKHGRQQRAQTPPSMAQRGPTSRPRRMMVSKEMSAARKLGTEVRIQTPSVSGTRKNASSARVCRGRRCSAKNRRRKVLARASTLATEATTPSFTSSVIRMSLSVTSSTVSRCGGTAQTQTDGSSAACELACA